MRNEESDTLLRSLFADAASSDMAVRRTAECALTKLLVSEPSYIPDVLQEIRAGDVTSRWYLARALINAGDSVIPVLTAHSRGEEDINVQKYIGAVLASFGEKSVAPLISLFSAENPKARGMAAAALERIGQPALEGLLAAVKSENPMVRTCAGLVLQKGGVCRY